MQVPSYLLFLTIIPLLSVITAREFKLSEKINLKEIVDAINLDTETTWKADTYGYWELDHQEISMKLGLKSRREESESDDSDLKSIFGRMSSRDAKKLRQLFSRSSSKSKKGPKLGFGRFLPKSYDTRQRYPQCKSIGYIRDQSNCGSCWAVSAASAFSDRLCIHTKGERNFALSAHFILSCDYDNYGCQGGYLDLAWEFLARNGTVTGDEFESDVGCQPYPIRPCSFPYGFPCANHESLTPKCRKNKCTNEFHPLEFENKTFKVEEPYQVDDGFLGLYNEYYIKEDIFLNGPVQAGFHVYADFMAYKSGVYQHKRGWYLGDHAVKIIGWGEENGVPYWTIANSWGSEWGENGTVKFYRGKNHCGIEDEVFAGIPLLK